MAVTPRELLDSIKEHKDFLGTFAGMIDKELTIYGIQDDDGNFKHMTPKDWRKHFEVKVPRNPSPAELTAVQSHLSELIDTAMYFLAHSQLIVDTFDESSAEKLDLSFQTIVKSYGDKRLPAEGTLRAMANAENNNLVGSKAAAITRFNFWKIIVKKLDRQIKLLEETRWTMHIDAKHIEG